jgi:uncharacterized protein YgiM (DUF1202 family)
MVRRRFHPLIAFAVVIAAAGSVTAAGLTFTAHTVSQTVAQLPEVKTRVLPSYVVRLPEAKAADLDISKAVEVKPRIKVPVTVPVAQANVTLPTAAAEPETKLVAEVTPLATETVEQPVAGGSSYIVSADVFVRSGPAKSYGQVGTVPRGTQVNVTGSDGSWMKISYAGGSGWVYQRYLARSGGDDVAEADTGRAPF